MNMELWEKEQTFLRGFNNVSLNPGGLTELDYKDLCKILGAEDELNLNIRKEGMIIADVGCWTGCSSMIMGTLVKDLNATVYSIDWFKGSPEGDMLFCGKFFNIKNILKENISFHDLDNIIKIKEGISHLVAEEFENYYFDFIFIDANHAFEFVSRDLDYWYPKLKQGGIIAGHDFDKYMTGLDEAHIKEPPNAGCHTGVIKAVQTKFKREHNKIYKLEGSVWYVKKP